MSSYKKEDSLHSEEINNIISSPPKWILRWGLTLFLFALTALGLICSVIPYPEAIKAESRINKQHSNFVAEISIPEVEIRRIKEGQIVLFKLTSYSFEKYGTVTGNISEIPNAPDENNKYRVYARLKNNTPDGGRPILLENGMTANAEIIVEEGTLLTRIFRTIFDN